MGAAIGQVLPFAVGVALSPVPIIAVALMLMSQRARLNGPLFVIGWLVGLAVIGVVVLAVAALLAVIRLGDFAWMAWENGIWPRAGQTEESAPFCLDRPLPADGRTKSSCW